MIGRGLKVFDVALARWLVAKPLYFQGCNMIGTPLQFDNKDYILLAVMPYSGGAIFAESGFDYLFEAQFEENGYVIVLPLAVRVVFKGPGPASGRIQSDQLQWTGFEKVREAFSKNFENVEGLTQPAGGGYQIDTPLIVRPGS